MPYYQTLGDSGQVEYFSELSDSDMTDLLGLMQSKTFAKGEVIYLPGDPANMIYLLVNGKVRIAQISDEGKESILSILTSGDIFGELALLDDESTRDEISIALEECLVRYINKADFEAFLLKRPEINLKVTKSLGLKLRSTEKKLYNLIFKDAFSRLESLLEQLASDYGAPHPEGRLITLMLTKQELGNLINVARPTVSEYLSELKRQGKVQLYGRKIVWVNSV